MIIDYIKKLFFRKRSKYAKIDQLRYLSQSALIEETVAPHVVRTTLVMVSIVIIILIIWGAFTEIEEIAHTEGEVIPSAYVQSIQHLEGGIVKEIKVRDGQLVEESQILVVLDGKDVRQDLEALRTRSLSLKYDALRLRSFINNTTPNFSSIGAKNATSVEIQEEQEKAFSSMIAARESEKEIIMEQIDQKKDAVSILEKKKITLTKNLELVGEEKDMKEKLVEKGHLSKLKYLQIQKQYNDVVGEINETDAAIIQAHNSIEEYMDRLDSLTKQHIDNAYQELNGIESDHAQVEETIKKLESQVARLEVRSPVFGFVKGVAITTIGGVIEAGQVIMQIVPIEGPLIVETKINPRDIGHVKIGQTSKVKVSSYDFSRYGSVEGTVEYISASTFIDDEGNKYYKGRIILSQNYVGNDSKKNIIVPGMTVQTDIVTGSKSILQYLLKPIHSSVSTALTER